MPVWWTKRSLPPSSGVTKPKPFSSLNHLTVPVAILESPPTYCALRTRRCYGGNDCGRWALLSPGSSPGLSPRKVALSRARSREMLQAVLRQRFPHRGGLRALPIRGPHARVAVDRAEAHAGRRDGGARGVADQRGAAL